MQSRQQTASTKIDITVGVSKAYYDILATQQQIALLEDLLKTRAELAKLVGMESYGHVFLIDKMVRNPGKVSKSLI